MNTAVTRTTLSARRPSTRRLRRLEIKQIAGLFRSPNTFQAQAVTVAYTSFLLESAWEGDMLLAYASVLPCQRLYDWLFETINRTKQISEENPYRKIILQPFGA